MTCPDLHTQFGNLHITEITRLLHDHFYDVGVMEAWRCLFMSMIQNPHIPVSQSVYEYFTNLVPVSSSQPHFRAAESTGDWVQVRCRIPRHRYWPFDGTSHQHSARHDTKFHVQLWHLYIPRRYRCFLSVWRYPFCPMMHSSQWLEGATRSSPHNNDTSNSLICDTMMFQIAMNWSVSQNNRRSARTTTGRACKDYNQRTRVQTPNGQQLY